MSDGTLGVGIVGLGRVSALHFAGFDAVDEAQVRAICDADGDLGAHALDLARFTLGDAADRIEDAAAMGAIFISQRRLQDGSGTGRVTAVDAINVCVRYDGGALGHMQLSRFSPGFFAFEIDGQEGSVRLSPATPDGCIELYEREPRDDQVPASEYVAVEVPERHEQAPTVFSQFVDAALSGEEVTPGFRDGVVIARQLDRIHEAAMIDRAD